MSESVENSTLSRTKMLLREVELIHKEQRLCRRLKYPTSADLMAQASLKLRLAVMESELESLKKQAELGRETVTPIKTENLSRTAT